MKRTWHTSGQDHRRSGTIQRALDRLYERHGVAGLLVAGSVIGAFVSSIIIVLVGTAGARLVDASGHQKVQFILLAEGMLLLVLAIGVLTSRHKLRVLLSWSRGGHTASRAEEAWRATVTWPTQVVWRTFAATVPLLVIFFVLWLTAFDLPPWVMVPTVIANGVFVAATGVFAMLAGEFALRPMMRDVATHLPSDFEPPPSMSLRAKVLIPIPGALMFVVGVTGAFVDTSASYAVRITVLVALWFVIAGAAMTLFLIATHAALDPIDELTEATNRIRRGDLATPVPVLSADELGTLAMSFNQMLDHMRRHESELRESRARIVATADEERRRVERDLHDGAQQRLVLINLKAEMLSQYVSPEGTALLNELRADAGRAVEELRDLAHGIYPPLLESDGLPGAPDDVAESASIPVHVETDGLSRYPSAVEAAVYFCCLEALQNAAKHAGDGAHVRIDLAERDGQLRFAVADDGRGFDPASVNGSGGVQNMIDRIGALGGTVRIDSTPGHGTQVQGTVPL